MNGECFKTGKGRFRCNTKKIFFPVREMRHWLSLPRKAVDAPPLELFLARNNSCFEQPGLVEVSLSMAGELELHDL